MMTVTIVKEDKEEAHVPFAWLSSWQLKAISDLQMAQTYFAVALL